MTLKILSHPSDPSRTYKMGRRRPLARHYGLRLGQFVQPSAIDLPEKTSYASKAMPCLDQIMLNDVLGDCTAAAAFHVEGLLQANAGRPKQKFSNEQVQAFYSATTGYRPGHPDTDNGGDEVTVLNYWRDHGLYKDGHRIAGHATVDATKWDLVRTAIYLFENVYFGMSLPDAWVSPMPSGPGWTWDVAGAPVDANGHCFTADTKISLLNGNEASFKELVEGKFGEKFWVYSIDDKGNVVPGCAHSARKTREKAKLLKITLDDESKIRCTEDHLFMDRSGTYVKACELVPGTSLMPLYRRENIKGYEEFLNPKDQKWKVTHREICKPADGFVVHHYDFNKKNNSPDNLKPMTPSAHMKLHAETAFICNEYARSPGGREKSRELMTALWAKPEWRTNMLLTAKERASVSARKQKEEGRCGFQAQDKQKLAELQHLNGVKAITRITSETNLAAAATAWRKKYAEDEQFRIAISEHAAQNIRKAHGKPLTAAQLEARRKNIVIAAQARLEKRVNHKVVSVEFAGYEDVYDLTVDTHHNFALSAGVFVHNCVAGVDYDSGDTEHYLQNGTVTIASWGMLGRITRAAVTKYATYDNGGELHTVLSYDAIDKASKKAPNGFDADALWAAFKQQFPETAA